MTIFEMTLALGTPGRRSQHETNDFEPESVEALLALLDDRGRVGEWEAHVPSATHIALDYLAESSSAALATFSRDRLPLTTAVLLRGDDEAADRDGVELFERMISRFYRAAGAKSDVGRGLVRSTDRPLVASLALLPPARSVRDDLALAGELTPCLAAVWLAS